MTTVTSRSLVERGERLQHLNLVAQIEEGRGLVKQQHFRLLRQGSGDEGALGFATGEAGDAAVAQMLEVEPFQSRGHTFGIAPCSGCRAAPDAGRGPSSRSLVR